MKAYYSDELINEWLIQFSLYLVFFDSNEDFVPTEFLEDENRFP